MNCGEFERVLLEGEHTPEQQAHLSSCSACANLQADLELISSQARLLFQSDEPSPAVWKKLEARLRSEGLLRLAEPRRPSFDFFRQWRTAWLVPAAAILVVVAVVRLHHPAGAGDNGAIAMQVHVKAPVTPAVSSDDEALLSTVASRPPAQRAKYRADLDDANAFIRDAEAAVRNDPNDIFRQQMLINAYEQKQMLYDLAVNHVSEQ